MDNKEKNNKTKRSSAIYILLAAIVIFIVVYFASYFLYLKFHPAQVEGALFLSILQDL